MTNFQSDYFLMHSPWISQSNKFKDLKFPGNSKPSTIIYRFTFISLIAPYLLSDLRISNITYSPSTPKKSTALLKQSYLLFTWFFYLKESKVQGGGLANNVIKFAFLPVRRTMYTLTKAPMAHKTNSKEQFVFRFFKFKTSIKSFFTQSKSAASVDQSLLALFLIKSSFPVFETNLLLLKHYTIIIQLSDTKFFSYYTFIKNRKLS